MISITQIVLMTPCFPMQAHTKLTALFEQRMDSYDNADARVSLESRFSVLFITTYMLYIVLIFFGCFSGVINIFSCFTRYT
jgi:hypothetical protein